ncbi:calcitonin gene-related peptide type 1 receptor-like [Centruroides sculpturatus]|uniref:calcitonin gene-related peptide type 1 receptor-like n=1 Tax=Centruroides sculpturatus TaxID=218467 RepID=UPI000C6D5C53|nr:calcitonin gene-related peptide type 1 receptor-like [Centruroides sculpturatus]
MIYLKYFFLFHLFIVSQGQNIICRGRNWYFSKDIFAVYHCLLCFYYIPEHMFPEGKIKLSYIPSKNLVRDLRTNQTFVLDPKNKSSSVYQNFANDRDASKWTDCCQAAIDCCDKMLSDPPLPKTDKKYCPRTWDGWQCWPDTLAGTTASGVCENHVYFKSQLPKCQKYAMKECLLNGEWYKANGSEWTDYSGCGARDVYVKSIIFHLVCFGISILALIPAIIIFSSYRSLKVYRITIHKNLFSSCLMTALSVIIFKAVVILDQTKANSKDYLNKNSAWCKLLFILTKYFRLTNYMWMFCEGFYLHKLIVSAFTEQKNLYLFYFIGWGIPLIIISIYSLLKLFLADSQCWSLPTNIFEWITNVPMIIALLGNLIFLCDINRVLLTKLRHQSNPNEPTQYRKAVRATLVLIPLFGLHSFLTIYRPNSSGSCQHQEAYNYVEYAMDGLQAAVISIIFCYGNSEIIGLLKRSLERQKLKKIGNNRRTNDRTAVSLSTVTRSSTISISSDHNSTV